MILSYSGLEKFDQFGHCMLKECYSYALWIAYGTASFKKKKKKETENLGYIFSKCGLKKNSTKIQNWR